MNSPGGAAPTCPKCGGLSINPSDAQCRFCGTALAPAYGNAPAYGAPPPAQAYGGPQAYAAPQPGGYGAPPPGPGYGAPPAMQYVAPQGYSQPPGYGGAPYPAPNPYGQPPPYGQANPYGQQPYGQQYPMAPVQNFGGNYGRQINNGWGFGGGWSTFLWVRLAIAGAFIALSLIGACISAITN